MNHGIQRTREMDVILGQRGVEIIKGTENAKLITQEEIALY